MDIGCRTIVRRTANAVWILHYNLTIVTYRCCIFILVSLQAVQQSLQLAAVGSLFNLNSCVFPWEGTIARWKMSRKAIKSINWAALAETIPQSEKTAFSAFKAKSDQHFRRSVNSNFSKCSVYYIIHSQNFLVLLMRIKFLQ